MRRRTFFQQAALCLGAATLFAGFWGGQALADVVPGPILLRVEGLPSTVTHQGGPASAFYTIHNDGDEAVDVFVHQVLVLDNGMRIPAQVRGVHHRPGGPIDRRVVRVPAHGSVPITVGFQLPASMQNQSSWRIELSVTSPIGNARGVAQIDRGHRIPAR